MGQNVSVLGTHNLDISNVETLAKDLSNRFGFTIEFGYVHNNYFNLLLNCNLDCEFVTLGTIKSKGRLYHLYDSNFQTKQLFENYGYALFEMEEYWKWKINPPTKSEIADEIKSFNSGNVDFHLTCTKAEHDLSIYKSVVNIDFNYYSKWSTFYNVILTREYFDDDFLRYRKSVLKNALLLGGDSVYFVNDQCSLLGGIGQGDEMDFTWQELQEQIKNTKDLELISISKSVLDSQYQKQISKTKEIVAFYDDFQDLKNSF